MSAGRVIVVTGSNKGIGLEIVKKVAAAAAPQDVTILAARDVERGEKAAQELAQQGFQNIRFAQLDIDSEQSVTTFSEWAKKEFGKLDVLVNNAAIAFKNADPTPFKDQAEPTVRVNFLDTVRLTEQLLPLLKSSEQARIVNVASRVGRLDVLKSEDLKAKFLSDSLTKEELIQIAKDFVTDISTQQPDTGKGWPTTCYGFSKACVIAYTRILARENPDIKVNACCPGYCITDMTSGKGMKSAEEGASTPFFLTQVDAQGPSGKFFAEEKEIEW